jgi:hypothetical protein
MKGKLHKIKNNWFIEDEYNKQRFEVHFTEIPALNEAQTHLDNVRVDYNYIDEFTHPEYYHDVPLYQGKVYASITGPLEVKCPYCGGYANSHNKSTCLIDKL